MATTEDAAHQRSLPRFALKNRDLVGSQVRCQTPSDLLLLGPETAREENIHMPY